ncbi:MAG: Ig-like domain-containing protein [Selenomonadaceae bacterium]|nr:Ig-like domain-containing protein [Selenomonadaceae bacterium]
MAVQKEIWQRTIIEGLFADNLFLSRSVNDDMYVNEGKKVHIPNAGAPSGVEKNRSVIPATVYKRLDQDVDYTLDELTTNPILIPYADMVELSYNKRNSVIDQDRKELIFKASEAILKSWFPGSSNVVLTTGQGVPAWTPSATGLRKKITPADVSALQVRMNADNVPQTDRYLLLDAQMYQQLLDGMTQTQAIGFFQAADVKRGVMGMLYGFEVMVRSTVYRFAADGTIKDYGAAGAATDLAGGLAWQRESLSRALGEVIMFDQIDNPLYYGDVYSFLVRVGGAIRRYDKKGVYAIKTDTATEVTGLTLDDTDIDIAKDGTQLVTATATPSSESAATQWEVIDTEVATIDKAVGASVTVTGVAAGQTILKATNGKKEVLAIITVTGE